MKYKEKNFQKYFMKNDDITAIIFFIPQLGYEMIDDF